MIERGTVDAPMKGTTLGPRAVRSTVIFDRTRSDVFGLSGLLGFLVALSVLTVSIAPKIFRIGD